MNTKFTIMGCGHSSGVPASGGFWGNCDPNEPKNMRMRSSLLIQKDGANIVVDTGADFRAQTIKYGVTSLDAVLYSHHHCDHCHGIDDIRPFYLYGKREPISCYGYGAPFEELIKRFDYLFSGGAHVDLYPQMLAAHYFDVDRLGKSHNIDCIEFIPFLMDHGTCDAVGYRFDKFAYSLDMKSLDKEALEVLNGVDVWVVDGAGYHWAENPAHACLGDLYRYNEIIGAKEVYISSLSTKMDYQMLCSELPEGFYPAYDGLSFEF